MHHQDIDEEEEEEEAPNMSCPVARPPDVCRRPSKTLLFFISRHPTSNVSDGGAAPRLK